MCHIWGWSMYWQYYTWIWWNWMRLHVHRIYWIWEWNMDNKSWSQMIDINNIWLSCHCTKEHERTWMDYTTIVKQHQDWDHLMPMAWKRIPKAVKIGQEHQVSNWFWIFHTRLRASGCSPWRLGCNNVQVSQLHCSQDQRRRFRWPQCFCTWGG